MTNVGIARIDIGRISNDTNISQLGMSSRARDASEYGSRSATAGSFERKTLIWAMIGPSTTAVHPGSSVNSATSRPVSSFSSRATLRFKIDLIADDVGRIRCPAGKIDFPGVESVWPHDPEQKSIVSSQDRGGTEAIVHTSRWPSPSTPSRKTCVVGLQVLAAKHAVLEDLLVHQQDLAVP